MLKPFVINRHGRLVFPCNFFPELDFSVFNSLQQFREVIARDFGQKAPSETEIVNRIRSGHYKNRYEVCRDLALNLFWVNRYVLTMYEKRPMRWGDLPRHRDDVFLPVLKPWDKAPTTKAIEQAYQALPALWDEEVEDASFRILLNVLHNKHSAGGLVYAIKPTVAEMLEQPKRLTYQLLSYDRDYPGYDYDDVIDYQHTVPELESLMRQAMTLHNQFRWDPAASQAVEVGKLRDDDYVVAFYPKTHEVLQFLRRVKHQKNGSANNGHAPPAGATPPRPPTLALSQPMQPYPPIEVRQRFTVMPRLEAIATYEGEISCTNADLIRNHAFSWSHMTEQEIAEKTGIERRCYSQLSLEDMALLAARAALAKSRRRPAEIGAVLFCSCTSTKVIPSVACWLSGELGLMQTHASCDIIAACAGMSYGLSEAVRLLQEVGRPILLICAEKFSDKIGTVRTSRMLFGDGAAAVVVGPAPAGAPPDIEVMQTYAGGPWSEVNSIIWPNPEFDNNLTVYGPEVKALAARYLTQMIGELSALPHPDANGSGSLLDAIELVVPHQANKNMVVELAEAAGVEPERLYFNIERVGNVSAASILMAIHDAVQEGRIDRPMRVFAPGFGAGAVGGYVVMRVDPAIVHCSATTEVETTPAIEVEHALSNGFSSLKGKVALITGASRGIGRAIALELAYRGAAIAINYRSDVAHAESAAQEIRDLGGECMLVQGDVANKEDARRVVREVIDKWLRLDILVNNAGITRDRTLKKMTDEDWTDVIDVNLNGTFYTTSAALPAMMNQRFGRIINISSVVGQSGAFGQANYSASKGGIIAFTKTLALEAARYNITANVVAPGYTLTEMVQAIPKQVADKAKASIPLGRFAEPEEVAHAVAFLAADADYITGQELNVNGGFHM